VEECVHGTIDDHSYLTKNGRVWVCDNCGHRGKWSSTWIWFGAYECRECGCGIIEELYCCELCKRGKKERMSKYDNIFRRLRKRARLTQAAVANHLGVSRQIVSSVELGKRDPTERELLALASLYRVSRAILKGEEEER
jgi:DNA-binding XRE family transcriptional regulator